MNTFFIQTILFITYVLKSDFKCVRSGQIRFQVQFYITFVNVIVDDITRNCVHIQFSPYMLWHIKNCFRVQTSTSFQEIILNIPVTSVLQIVERWITVWPTEISIWRLRLESWCFGSIIAHWVYISTIFCLIFSCDKAFGPGNGYMSHQT